MFYLQLNKVMKINICLKIKVQKKKKFFIRILINI